LSKTPLGAQVARVTCEKCNLSYDDTYRLTICPHIEFKMNCLVMRGDGETKTCTGIEEMDEFLGVGHGQTT
jgi:hypothetical protein